MEFIDFPNSYSDAQLDNLLNIILQTESNSITSPPLSPSYPSPLQYSQSPPTTTFAPPTATSTEQMRELMYCMAAMQPIKIDPDELRPPKRRNVRISSEPQSVAARLRRERISERIRILQRMVPGGTKMDTASMLDEAIQYVKFLKRQVQTLEHSSGSFSSGGNADQTLYFR